MRPIMKLMIAQFSTLTLEANTWYFMVEVNVKTYTSHLVSFLLKKMKKYSYLLLAGVPKELPPRQES